MHLASVHRFALGTHFFPLIGKIFRQCWAPALPENGPISEYQLRKIPRLHPHARTCISQNTAEDFQKKPEKTSWGARSVLSAEDAAERVAKHWDHERTYYRESGHSAYF